MNSKKGEGWKDIQYAVIATIVIVLLAAFTYNYFSKAKEKLAIHDCKNSIGAHALLAEMTEFEIVTDIKCPTRQLVIKTGDEQKAKKQIAEDMRRCWYEWGRGNLKLFEGDGIFCHVCSIYTFDNNSKRLDGLLQYIATTKMPPRFPEDPVGISYQDYFQGFSSPQSEQEFKKSDIQGVTNFDTINTSYKYATVFVYASGKDFIDKALENGGRTTAITFGGAALLLGTAATITGTTIAISAISSAITATAVTATAVGGTVAVAGTVAAINWWNPVGWIAIGVVLVAVGTALYYVATDSEDMRWISFITIRPYNEKELIGLGCEKAPVNQQSNVG
ncbi:MAG: hypothetical protein WC916_07075 [Candidatus Woesearchaeota archaeon]